jgi:hypothetical protein
VPGYNPGTIRLLLLFLGDPVAIGIRIGWRIPEAIEALEQPAVNPTARHYRIAALSFFTVTGLLAIPAAIVHTIFGQCHAFDILGFGALYNAGLCIVCGIRYGELNRQAEIVTHPDATLESS